MVEGGASDIENFKKRLRGEDDRELISGALAAEIDKAKFDVTFSSDNTSNLPSPSERLMIECPVLAKSYCGYQV